MTPSYSITANGSTDDSLSRNSIYSIPSTNNSFIPCFKSNISKAYFNGNTTTDLCQSGETQELTKNINTLIVNVSSSEISKTVTISGEKSLIFVNESLQLTATTSDSTTNSIIWSSSDESIATVDKDTGIVTGISDGTATIFARIDGEFTGDSYIVEIMNPDAKYEIISISIKSDKESGTEAYTATVTAEINPSYYSSDLYTFEWKVVDDNGTIVTYENKFNENNKPYTQINVPQNVSTTDDKKYKVKLTVILNSDGKEAHLWRNNFKISKKNKKLYIKNI